MPFRHSQAFHQMSTEILKIDRFGKPFQLVASTTQSLKMFLKTEKLLRMHDAS